MAARKQQEYNGLDTESQLASELLTVTPVRAACGSPAPPRELRMTPDTPGSTLSDWRNELPIRTARLVTLREPTPADLRPLIDLRSIADATSFGIDEPAPELAMQQLIDRAGRERAAGSAFTYVIT